MIKKCVLAILISLYFVHTGLAAGSNPAFLQWLKDNKNKSSTDLSSEVNLRGVGNTQNKFNSRIPLPFDISRIKSFSVLDENGNVKRSPTAILRGASINDPYYNDLRLNGYLSPIRDQFPYGNCWAYAVYASLEANLRKAGLGSYDFSEYQMSTTHGFDPAINAGGNNAMAIAFLSRWGGPVAENTTAPVLKHVQNAYWIPNVRQAYYGTGYDLEYITNVKKALLAYGPVAAGINSKDYFWRDNLKYFYAHNCSAPNGIAGNCNDNGHAISIVGWDNNIAPDNFSVAPPGAGAFIARNSYGDTVGDGGYFYISYYDTSLGADTAVFETPEGANNYSGVYSYDNYGYINSVGRKDFFDANGTTSDYIAWAANIYTAETNASLKAVSFYTTNSNVAYEVYLSTGVSKGLPVSGNMNLISSGVMSNTGYHTIKVPSSKNILVRKDEYFSVVLKVTDPGTSMDPLAVEIRAAGYSSNATASAGQSYYSSDGMANNWKDLTSFSSDFYGFNHSNSNFPIKVFIENDPTGPVMGEVRDGTGADIDITDEDTVLRANWSAASDPDTGVYGYKLAIGTAAGSTDVLDWKDIGKVTAYTASNLTLAFGQTYYIGVKAYNKYETEGEAVWTDGQKLWYKRPANIPYVNDGLAGGEETDTEYILNSGKLSAHWKESTITNADTDSQAIAYEYAIGTARGGTDILNWIQISSTQAQGGIFRVENTTNTANTIPPLEDGYTYYYSVRAKDANGKYSTPAYSNGQTVDETTPQINYVVMENNVTYGNISGYFTMNEPYERLAAEPKFSFKDSSASTTTPLAVSRLDSLTWAFTGIVQAGVHALGAAEFAFSAKSKAGKTGTYIVNGSSFTILQSTVSDHSVPVWGNAIVRDGLGAEDIDSTSSNTSLSANWDEASDPESGIEHYEYSIGTLPYGSDILGWTSNGKLTSVTKEGLALDYGATYYFTIKAFNKSGLVSDVKTSDGQWIDEAKPAAVSSVICSFENSNPEYVHWISTFAARWAMSGQSASTTTAAIGYEAALGKTAGSSDVKGWTDLGDVLSTVFTGLSLTDRDYYFSVRAYNALNRKSDIRTCKLTVDLLEPSIKSITLASSPQNTGAAINGVFELSEEYSRLSAAPELYYKVASGDKYPLAISPASSGGGKYWNFSGYVNTYYPAGSAEFIFYAKDKAGNSGSTIQAGASFTINSKLNNSSSALNFVNSDGCAVTLPAGAVNGDVTVTIEPADKSISEPANANSPDSSALRVLYLDRDFNAYSSTGGVINSFQKGATITFPYLDADNDKRTDGDYFDVDSLFIHHLDTSTNKWVPLSNSVRDYSKHEVSAVVNHFSIYSLRSVKSSIMKFNVAPSPNPCRFTKNTLTFRGLPVDAQDVKIYIYNSVGELVRELDSGVVVWDGKNKQGARVASGIYIYLVKTSNRGKARGKLYAVW